MSEIQKFFNNIKDKNKEILTHNFIKELSNEITNQVDIMFPILNSKDTDIMKSLSIYLHNYIIEKNNLSNKIDNIEQFTQNNYRDIKAIILMLLPYVDDKNDNIRFKTLSDLNQILYNKLGKEKISVDVLNKSLLDARKDEFYFSNFGMGLLNSQDKLLNLFNEKGDKLIHEIIYHNFIALLETIKMCHGKYYVNWINIVPILEEEYRNSEIYKNTINSINDIKNKENDYFNSYKYKGLWFGDLYNVLRNGYYQSIKSSKWLIFNRINAELKQKEIKNQYYLQILDDKLDLKNHLSLNIYKYNDLPDDEQLKFKKKLEDLVSNLDDRNTKNIYFDMLKQLLIYFVNNYSLSNKINFENKNNFTFEKEENDEGKNTEDFSKKDSEKFNKIEVKDIKKAFDSIKKSDIWDYLKEVIEHFRSTIYATFLLNGNKVNHDFYYIKLKEKEDKDELTDTKINLKNLYNIAKLLSHHKNPWKLRNTNFTCLYHGPQDTSVKEFTNDFNLDINANPNNWFNINKNIEIEINVNDKDKIKERRDEISQNWDKFKYDLIFIYLIRRGLLTKFTTDFNLTNKEKLPTGYKSKNKKQEKLLQEKFKKNKNWKNAYYYLNNKKYSELDKIRHDEKKNIEEESYFDIIPKYQSWYKFYAMDWITQIKFFHTYINHQVMYVTGSTGQGKSTQVPKLLMYALKMIDYKENGSVICTQPRIPPTTNNAERISFELGVPIIVPSYTLKDKVNTENFYCQYKYQGAQHTTKSNKGLTLKIVTDGTLMEEIKTNQIMKKTKPGKSGKPEDITFTDENKYDILIIDEAHEHNSNMDLILTLARNACYFNNSIRLIIISATMDDDEPIYRSYFNIINDNIIYPIKQPIYTKLHPILKDTLEDGHFLPWSVYMERRFHISPPGETTQYTITDIYKDLPENLGSDEENAKFAQTESYKVVIEICNRSTHGEVLLFSTGQGEIIQAVEYLNKNMPSGNVALPYFGTMNKKYKDIIEKIDKNIFKIKNKRTNIYREWGSTFIEDPSVPDNIYTRAIIVATNVAEASVTIPRLTYVIDNGFAKEASYDEKKGSSTLEVDKISEASRMQRRGRVGRIGDGTVYYMYREGARKDIMPKYKINQMNTELIFTSLGCKKDYETKEEENKNILYPGYYDPHYYNIFHHYYKTNEVKISDTNVSISDTTVSKLGIKDIINNQFTSDEFQKLESDNSGEIPALYFPEPYFINMSGERENAFSFLNTYQDGIALDELLDKHGNFYLIHPKEDRIIRNCAYGLYKRKDTDKEIKGIPGNWFRRTLFNLQNKLQIVNVSTSNNILDNSKELELHKLELRRTELGQKIKNLAANMTVSESIAMTLVYAYGHSKRDNKNKSTNNILNDTLMIIAMLEACQYSVKNLAKKVQTKSGYQVADFYNLKQTKIFHSDRSDIESIYKITQKIKNTFHKLKIFQLDKKYYKKYEDEFNKLTDAFEKTNISSQNKYDPPKDFDKEWNKLNELKNNGKLKDGWKDWAFSTNIIDNSIDNNIKKDSVAIKNFCDNNYLDLNTVLTFFKIYLSLKRNLDTIDRNDDKDQNIEMDTFTWIDDNFINNFQNNFPFMTDIDKIIHSFLSGHTVNVIFKTTLDDNYFIMSSVDKTNIEPLNKSSSDYASFIDNPGSILFYLGLNRKTNNAEIITKISINDLIIANPLYYNPIEMKNIYVEKNDISNLPRIIEFKGNVWESILYNLKNNWNIDKFVWKDSQISNNKNVDTNLIQFIKNTYSNIRRLNY